MKNIEDERGLKGLSFPDSALTRLAEDLAVEYEGIFSPQTVGRYVLESYAARLRISKVKAHLLNTTARFVRERLNALAQSMDAAPKDVPEVLFICVHNAGRSQMAMGLMKHHAQGRVHVRSAGSMPATEISRSAIQVMEEVGIDITEEFPKPLTDDVVQAADVVITMGCGDACPVYPGKKYLDWELDDIGSVDIDGVRRIRDEIEARVHKLIDELAAH